MKARAFAYVRAASIDAALQAYAAAQDASYIAGGQSLVPALALRLQAPDVLIDIAHIEELRGVNFEDGRLRIGALTRHAEVLSSPLIGRLAPLLQAAAAKVAHAAIRNRGTIGGSVALADPAAEFPAMMLVLDAELEAVGPNGRRRIAAGDFFTGLYTTALKAGELLAAVHIPVIPEDARWAFDEIARRRGDYALVGAGVQARVAAGVLSDSRIVFFGVGETPVRMPGVERLLDGQALTAESIARAQEAVAANLMPREDASVPAAMRVHLARVLLGRLLARMEHAR